MAGTTAIHTSNVTFVRLSFLLAPHLRYGPHHRVLDEAGLRHTAYRFSVNWLRTDAAPGKLCILIAETGCSLPSAPGKVARGGVLCRNSPWLPGVGCFGLS